MESWNSRKKKILIWKWEPYPNVYFQFFKYDVATAERRAPHCAAPLDRHQENNERTTSNWIRVLDWPHASLRPTHSKYDEPHQFQVWQWWRCRSTQSLVISESGGRSHRNNNTVIGSILGRHMQQHPPLSINRTNELHHTMVHITSHANAFSAPSEQKLAFAALFSSCFHVLVPFILYYISLIVGNCLWIVCCVCEYFPPFTIIHGIRPYVSVYKHEICTRTACFFSSKN